jgi:hypothetical protein
MLVKTKHRPVSRGPVLLTKFDVNGSHATIADRESSSDPAPRKPLRESAEARTARRDALRASIDAIIQKKVEAALQARETSDLKGKPVPIERHGRLALTSRAVKVTLVLDPAQLHGVTLVDSTRPQPFVVTVGERQLTGTLNPKPLRRVLATIREHGPDKVAVILQGKLEAGDIVAEAGVSAMVKTPKNGGRQ